MATNYPWKIKFMDGTDATEYQNLIAPLIRDCAEADESIDHDELEMACENRGSEKDEISRGIVQPNVPQGESTGNS